MHIDYVASSIPITGFIVYIGIFIVALQRGITFITPNMSTDSNSQLARVTHIIQEDWKHILQIANYSFFVMCKKLWI